MENRKYAFELKAKGSVEIYDWASSDEVVTLDDAHIQDFLKWYFDDDGSLSVAPLLGIPQVKALVDTVQLLESVLMMQKGSSWINWANTLRKRLAPFKVPE